MSDQALIPFIHEDGPTFEEAWQVEALAMANALVEAKVISARDWAEALGSARSQQKSQTETVELYYVAVLDALESVLTTTGIQPEKLKAYKRRWEEAYKSTPHGQPVRLD